MPGCGPAKGNTLFDATPYELAFENLVTAMRAEFLRALAAIDQLRQESHILRGEISGHAGAAAQHVDEIEAHAGPSGKVTGLVPARLLSDEGSLTTASRISRARCPPSSLAKSDIGADCQVRITWTEHEPEFAWDSEAAPVATPIRELSTISSSSGGLSTVTSNPCDDYSSDVDERKPQDVPDMGTLRPEARNPSSMDEPERRRISISSNASSLSKLSVCDLWRNAKPKLLRRSTVGRRLSQEAGVQGVRAGDKLKEDSVFQPFVLDPWRSETWVWDTLVGLVAAYELVIVPLQVFSVTLAATSALDLITACVWTFDILVGFLRGRDIGGVVDMRPSTIAKRYLQTWFVPDFAFVCVDWVFITAGSTTPDVGRTRLRRMLRFMRVLRVLRITQIVLRVRGKLSEMSCSDYVAAFSSVIKFLFAMGLVNHYVACGWYAIADIGIEPNWIANTFNDSDSIQFRYSTAYHWSLTQFTPASMEVVPTNAIERAYSVGAIFFGLVMFTSFVSHVTNAVARIQRLTADTDMQRRDLRKYVQCHQVSFDLGKQIQAYVQVAKKRMKSMRLLESDVTGLRMLPPDLLRRLREEVHTPALSSHPFFDKLQGEESSAFISICNLAAAEENVLIGEELFRCGQTATKMYFSTAGDLSYQFGDFSGYTVDKVPAGSWFSEATLWCNWTHKGRMMTSDGLAEIVTVNAMEFHTIVSSTVSVYQAQRYAKMYALLAVDECGSKELITDICGQACWVAMAVRYAWAPSFRHSLGHSKEERWPIKASFCAWKIHTRSRKGPASKAQRDQRAQRERHEEPARKSGARPSETRVGADPQ